MLLTENRVSKVKEMYNIPSEVWEPMVTGSAVISPNQKYLEWLAKVWRASVSTPDKVEQQRIEGNVWTGTLNGLLTTVEEFDRVRPNLKKKDLYQYRDRQEVIDSLEGYKLEKSRNIETHDESEVVYENNRFKVVVPKSHTASCYYGAGTKWCTASRDNPGHFTNYDRDGKLFYILDKQAPTSSLYYKVALNKTYKGSNTWYDAIDDVMTASNLDGYIDTLNEFEIINKIKEYFKFTYNDEISKISDEEKQRELERIAREAEWAQRRRERELRLEASALERRENDSWKLDETGTIGTLANAVMEFLKDSDEWDTENHEMIVGVGDEIEDMRNTMENDPDVIDDPSGERAQDYGQDLGNLEDELESLKNEKHDIYDIRYDEYSHYDLPVFEYGGAEYAVGDEDMADSAAEENVKSLIDDVGYNGFSPGFMEWYIDGDAVADDFEDMFWQDMEDNPEDYLDEANDRELTNYAVQQIEAMDEQIGEYQEELEETTDESDEEYLVDQIQAIKEEKEQTLEDDDSYEWTEEAKEQYVYERKKEAMDDPVTFLEDMGYGSETFEQYIDKDKFVEGVISSDGRGNSLSSYDGFENEVYLGDEIYYIYRIN